MINPGMMSSKTDDWATPQDFFDKVNEEFHFELDVCASQDNAKCDRYFTRQCNGLAQDWDATAWLNPPYGREIIKWVKKASEAKVTVVGLLPARTDTKWFHEYVLGKADEIRPIRGRLKFGDAKSSAPFPSLIAVWRKGEADSGSVNLEARPDSGRKRDVPFLHQPVTIATPRVLRQSTQP